MILNVLTGLLRPQRTPRIPEVVPAPPIIPRPEVPRRQGLEPQEASAREQQLFRRRGRRSTLITAGQGAGAQREAAGVTQDRLGRTGT